MNITKQKAFSLALDKWIYYAYADKPNLMELLDLYPELKKFERTFYCSYCYYHKSKYFRFYCLRCELRTVCETLYQEWNSLHPTSKEDKQIARKIVDAILADPL